MRRKVLAQDEEGWCTVLAIPREVRKRIPAVRNVRGLRRKSGKGKVFSPLLRLFPSFSVVDRSLTSPNCTPTSLLLPQPLPISHPSGHPLHSLPSQSPKPSAVRLLNALPPPYLFKTFKTALRNPTPLLLSPDHPMATFRGKRPRSVPSPDSPLPPPDPTNPSWHGRCFSCSQLGHTRASCPNRGVVCARCRKPGHEAKNCLRAAKDKAPIRPKSQPDSLFPRRFVGEKDFPVGRPNSVTVFIPQGPDSIRELQRMTFAVVVDARLRSNLDHDAVQATVMTVCRLEQPVQFLHSSDHRYILLLPKGWERAKFICTFASQL